MTSWDYFFVNLSVYSALIPLSVLLKKRCDQSLWPIVTLIVLAFVSDIISFYLIKGSNYSFLQVYGGIEILLLLYFYHKKSEFKKTVLVIGTLLAVLYLLNSFILENGKFNTIGRSLESIVFLFLAMKLFYQFFRKEEDIFLDKSPVFWINVGILVYFSGAFFTFIFSEYILDPRTVPMWRLHNSSNFLKNLFFAIALWKVK